MSEETVSNAKDLMALSNPPLWVIGNPRSGTSLLRLMLTCHSEVMIPPEGHHFLWLEGRYGQRSFPDATEEFLDELVGTKKFETWRISRESLRQLFDEVQPTGYREAVALVYCSYGVLKGRRQFRFWGDKNKLWKEKLPRVRDYFPETRFLHIVRDGRDVACSFKALAEKGAGKIKYGPKLPSEIEEIAERWGNNIRFIQGFLGEVETERCLTVRFEDLVRRPRATLGSVVDWLGIGFEEGMLEFAERNKAEQLEPAETMAWKGKLNEALAHANIGKYRKILSANEIARFEARCRDLLESYGY